MMIGFYFLLTLLLQQIQPQPTASFHQNPNSEKTACVAPTPLTGAGSIQLPVSSIQYPIPIYQDTSFFQKIQAQLAASNRHFSPEKVYLQFDRTFFEPGEAIWFSAYVRDANSLKTSKMSDVLYVQLLAPNGSLMQEIQLLAKGGQAAGDFQLPPSANGGLYKIRAFTNWMKNTDEAFERNLQVQATVLPRLRMELDFEREAYGPGDAVEAKLDLNSLANEPLKNHPFTATASLAGQPFTEVAGQTDGFGKAKINFKLPQNLATNDGLLNVRLDWQGQPESISRSVPIVLNKIDLQFLPEGGDLVAGLPARLAFKALNEFGKPADVAGEILDPKGKVVADFRSYHQGMGSFWLPPNAGEAYTARLTKPEGITAKFALPAALPRGFSMQVSPAKTPGQPLAVEVHSTENEELMLVLTSRGDIYFTQKLPAKAGSHHLEIPTGQVPIGIAQVTLFDAREMPRAERLVFLNPHKKLNVQVAADKPKYLPREKVELTLTVTDERGLPVPGQFSLAVADDNLLTFADDKQGHILSHFLLESDLKGEVTEPNFYFDPPEKHPEKDQSLALDHLMLTQGWRRLDWGQILWEEPVAMAFENERAVTSGSVTDKEGSPVPRLWVKLDGTTQVALTDAFGRFQFDTLLPQGVVVQVDHPNFSGYAGRTRSGWEKVNIQLPLLSHSYAKTKGTTIHLKDAQTVGMSFLQGKVTDEQSGEPLIFGTVALFRNGVLETGTETDLDGFYSITEIEPGYYDVEFSYTGYSIERVNDVVIEPGKVSKLDGKMSSGMELMEVMVVSEQPLIEQDATSSGMTMELGRKPSGGGRPRPRPSTPEKRKEAGPAPAKVATVEIKDLPTRDVNGLVAIGAGVASADEAEAIAVRGRRDDAANFFIDGVRVSGNMVPKQELKRMTGSLTGTPAQFADGFDDEEMDGGFMMEMLAPAAKKAPAMPAPAQRIFYTPRNFPAPVYEPRNQKPETRTDFRKTIHWQPVVKAGRDGKATVSFYTSDAITTFRVTVEGIGVDGSPGRGEQRFFTQLPFSLDAKLPVNLLTGDQLAIPVTLINNTGATLEGGLEVAVPAGFSLLEKWPDYIQLAAGESKTFYPKYEVGSTAQGGTLMVKFSTQGLEDSFERPVKVQSKGFPVDLTMGGNEQEQRFVFDISNMIEGSLSANFQVHPSVLSDLTSGMERMLRQPGGCFEQTSSSNYPNLLVLNFLQKTGNANPAVETQARQYLADGYNRLLSFEVKGGGFDWFGTPPAHEALTAYGLLEFVDMQAVHPVGPALIARTAKWLLTRRDGQGGWQSSKAGLHSWQQPGPIADAYITWAMTEAGYGHEVLPEAEKTLRDATAANDPYLLALAANILLKMDDQRAAKVLEKLAKLQAEDGSWTGLTHSMTHSTGRDLTVETTALATLAFLKNKGQQAAIQRGVDFLAKAKTPYGFGSTQATVLALKALVEHAVLYRQQMGEGTVELFANGKKIGEQTFSTGQQTPIAIAGLAGHLAEGRNEVTVRFANAEATLPFDLSVKYSTRQPQSSEACKVQIQTQIQKQNCGLGETVRLTTTLTNRSAGAVPNPIAIVGIPAGLTVQPWQVKELQERGVCDFYEIMDSYLVFYFRQMEGGEARQINLDLKADLPGSYEAPASMAYLYYSNEDVVWSKPERVVVVP